MSAYSQEEMLEYLEYAIDAEREVEMQKQIMAVIEQDFENKKPVLQTVEEFPEMQIWKIHAKHEKPSFGWGYITIPLGFLITYWWFFTPGGLSKTNGLPGEIGGKAILTLGALIWIALFIIGPFWLYYSKKEAYERLETEQKTLTRQYNEYQDRKHAYEETYKRESTEWSNSKYQVEQEMSDSINNSIKVRDRLFRSNCIYAKYHTLAALTSIYEYFITGRCDSLSGPHGAYNLYEDEMRQDKIISQLNIVIEKLEEIKSNQYMLFEEVSKIKEVTDDVKISLERSNDYLHDIKQNQVIQNNLLSSIKIYSAISAYCDSAEL